MESLRRSRSPDWRSSVETWMPIETEEDRRLRKRNAVIKAIKERREYKLYRQGDFALDAVLHEIPEPVTPDPEASSSKRDWERRIMKWRTTLKVITGVIPLQELKYERLQGPSPQIELKDSSGNTAASSEQSVQ